MDKFSSSVNLVEELASDLNKYVQIADHHGLEDTYVDEDVEPYESSGSEVTEAMPSLKKYNSFPPPRKTTPSSSSSSSEKEDEELKLKEVQKTSAPEHLVSAMKGSREKRGGDQAKLRVTWAPDVYDPTPTSMSHVVRKGAKQQKLSRKDKRHGKKGHKGKDFPRGSGNMESSNGAGGNDKKKRKKKKKQGGQTPAGSNTCYQYLDAGGKGLLDLKPDQVENFDTGIMDASCGSSFMKNSITKAHYPVAEAS